MSMGSDMYREQILDHYKNPRNYGDLDDPTFSHIGENPLCGDEIKVDIKQPTIISFAAKISM